MGRQVVCVILIYLAARSTGVSCKAISPSIGDTARGELEGLTEKESGFEKTSFIPTSILSHWNVIRGQDSAIIQDRKLAIKSSGKIKFPEALFNTGVGQGVARSRTIGPFEDSVREGAYTNKGRKSFLSYVNISTNKVPFSLTKAGGSRPAKQGTINQGLGFGKIVLNVTYSRAGDKKRLERVEELTKSVQDANSLAFTAVGQPSSLNSQNASHLDHKGEGIFRDCLNFFSLLTLSNCGVRKTRVRRSSDVTSSGANTTSSTGSDFLASPDNVALYVVLPLLVLIYGGCCVIYCCHRLKRFLKHRARHRGPHFSDGSILPSVGSSDGTLTTVSAVGSLHQGDTGTMARQNSRSSLPTLPNSVGKDGADEDTMIREIRTAMSDTTIASGPTQKPRKSLTAEEDDDLLEEIRTAMFDPAPKGAPQKRSSIWNSGSKSNSKSSMSKMNPKSDSMATRPATTEMNNNTPSGMRGKTGVKTATAGKAKPPEKRSQRKLFSADVTAGIEEIEAIPLEDLSERKPGKREQTDAINETSLYMDITKSRRDSREALSPMSVTESSDTSAEHVSSVKGKYIVRKHKPDIRPMVAENIYPIIKKKKTVRKTFSSD